MAGLIAESLSVRSPKTSRGYHTIQLAALTLRIESKTHGPLDWVGGHLEHFEIVECREVAGQGV